MMNQESKPTIEDLLRLKRAEHPPAGFWIDFDRELRAKQLAALVEKRPWWRSLPRRLRGVARYHLPLGATAVLAVTLLTIRDYEPILPGPSASISKIDGAAVGELDEPGMASHDVAAALAGEHAAGTAGEQAAPAAPTVALSSEAAGPGELARMLPMLSAGDTPSATEIAPSARSIAENRAVAEMMLGTPASTFETRALPVRTTPPEPLAQMSNPSETRRSRFAMAFAAAAVGTSPAPTARVARRLSDEQLYDSIHRFGASGNSVSFKF